MEFQDITVRLLLLIFCSSVNSKIVLKSGSHIIGSSKETYDSYEGIPYAKPPIGPLRFDAPKPFDLPETFEATAPGSKCAQLENGRVIGSEDCLFLNVYVPKTEKQELMPVMVFVHGGAFVFGSGAFYGPERFMETKSVIMITFNYRLGPLGFLSLEKPSLPGNAGLKDQLLVLHWIKENIKSFGGDDESITLFGNSAGGISSLLLGITPQNPGLFHKAVIQSGPGSFGPFATSFHRPPSYYAEILAGELGCNSDVEKCLRSADLEKIVGESGMFVEFDQKQNPWKPVDDAGFSTDPLFPRKAQDMFKDGTFPKIPVMIGSTKDEGALAVDMLKKDPTKFEELFENFDIAGPTAILGVPGSEVTQEYEASANIIRLYYIPGSNATVNLDEHQTELVQMFSDFHYVGPIDADVKVLSSQTQTYYYHYRYDGTHSYAKNLGVAHFDECFLLFELEGYPLSEKDKAMSQELIKLWTNFAIKGKPSNSWTAVTDPKEPKYVVIDATISKPMREKDFSERMKFVESSFSLLNAYHGFDINSHPAIKAIQRDIEHEDL